MRLSISLLLLLGTAAAADPGGDAVKAYKKEIGHIVARQRIYEGKFLDPDLVAAKETLWAPFRNRGGPDAPKVIDYDFTGYDEVFERWAGYEEEKGVLALSMARVDGKKVAERLFATLLEVLTEIQRQNLVLPESRPKTWSIHDQIPGIKRYGAWVHRDMLVEAIGKLRAPEALEWLTKRGWDKAVRWDRSKKSFHARVALLDAMAAPEWNAARSLIEENAGSKDACLRIAALETLMAFGTDPRTKQLISDAAERDECWAVRIAAGKLLQEAPPEPPKGDPYDFCGLEFRSDRFILVLDGNRQTVRPLSVELMKTRTWREWRSVAEKDREWLTQLGFLKNGARDLLAALPSSARLNMILLNEGNTVVSVLPQGMVPASPKGKRRVSAFIDEMRSGGWAPQIGGIWEACRIAGADPFGKALPEDPEADTILLASNGVPRGGQFMYGPAIVDDVARHHRFNRIRIHTLRFGDAAEPAEEVMKGIAEATGGTYLHVKEP